MSEWLEVSPRLNPSQDYQPLGHDYQFGHKFIIYVRSSDEVCGLLWWIPSMYSIHGCRSRDGKTETLHSQVKPVVITVACTVRRMIASHALLPGSPPSILLEWLLSCVGAL